jgi:hypothetical protein
MTERRRRWLPIVAGIGILVAFLAVGGIFAVVTLVRESVDVSAVSDGEASSQFDQVKAQFAERPPLIELTSNGQARYSEQPASVPSPSPRRLETLYVLVWDPDERHLARFSLPFWLLRMKSTPIRVGAYFSGLDDEGVQLRVEDIDRYGPGIVLDHTTTDGERVLFWAQ